MSKNKYLFFTSIENTRPQTIIGRNTVLAIIDFWLKDNEIPKFIESYKDVCIMLLTNKEVYDKLCSYNCSFPIMHWPLSLPDNNRFDRDSNYIKDIDFCTFGRVNPFFIRMLNRYCESHPGFTYVYSKGKASDRSYFNSKGDFIIKDTGRASYIDMMRRTKITCYSTPGIDESKRETDMYNQVTPRVLEMLSNGCMVIGHYPLSSDVLWYDLPSIVPNIETYDEFEMTLDMMLSSDLDIESVKRFLSRHYTSERARMLKEILEKD